MQNNNMSTHEMCLILKWQDIVGTKIGEYTRPKKISYTQNTRSGTLYLIAINGGTELKIHSMIHVIVAKISIFFGYKIINNIKVQQET
ncbi:DUF721 domain-containing protein [Wolbachia endosymbiont of Howardula sp.]|uniref:DUF721 domain-containing protein n=1 Tax=Wolbachia endosymbiont of Howardula sp. TaxID=2916816 RepID=UPI00217DAAB2|nr:DUF721 domain-containing protein [Wolbachia endosymbiont of Howardula sp.]UWI83062.1 DUF721 domain-containing protein [Wolbachia endosymbiont of Howardula sp.]